MYLSTCILVLGMISGSTFAFSIFGFRFNEKHLSISNLTESNYTGNATVSISTNNNNTHCYPVSAHIFPKLKSMLNLMRYTLTHYKYHIIHHLGVDGFNFGLQLSKNLNLSESVDQKNSTPCLTMHKGRLLEIIRAGCKHVPCPDYLKHKIYSEVI